MPRQTRARLRDRAAPRRTGGHRRAHRRRRRRPRRLCVLDDCGGAATTSLFESFGDGGRPVQLGEARAGQGGVLRDDPLLQEGARLAGVDVKLETRATVDDLASFDKVVLATGVTPRPLYPGEDHPKVMSYIDVLTGRRRAGRTVAVVGAGGIGFDVSEYLAHGDSAGGADEPHHPQLDDFLKEWSIDGTNSTRGGLLPAAGPRPPTAVVVRRRPRADCCCSGSEASTAPASGKTGLDPPRVAQARHVTMLGGVTYVAVDETASTSAEGRHAARLGRRVDRGARGADALRAPSAALRRSAVPVYLIGGAHEAGELDEARDRPGLAPRRRHRARQAPIGGCDAARDGGSSEITSRKVGVSVCVGMSVSGCRACSIPHLYECGRGVADASLAAGGGAVQRSIQRADLLL